MAREDKLNLHEQAWVTRVSSSIGFNLFDLGVHKTRKSDVELIKEKLTEIISALKENSKQFDIDILRLEEENLIGQGSASDKGYTSLTKLFYDNSTIYTAAGYITGGIQLSEQKLEQNSFTDLVQKEIANAYSSIADHIDATKDNYNKETYDRLDAFKKEVHKDDPLKLKEWERQPKRQEDLKLTVGSKEFSISNYSVTEYDESGKTYQVISPMVDAKLLEAFAKDTEGQNVSLNQWLRDKVPSLTNEVVIADVNAEISEALEQGSFLKEANLSGSKIRHLDLTDTDCRNMQLRDCDIEYMSINDSLFGGLDLRGADIDKLAVNELQFSSGAEQGFKAEEIIEDRQNPIHLSVANTETASKNKIMRDSLYTELEGRGTKALDAHYVRGSEGLVDLSRREVIKADRADVEEYLGQINELKVVQELKSGERPSIDWLKDGIPAFNEFIAGKKNKDNVFADLSEVDLTGLTLTGANFMRVNLYGTNMREVDSSHVNFFGACLEGAELGSANLANSILAQANMQYVKASGANLSKANLNDANLERAQMHNVKGTFQARRANMRFADLEGAEIPESDLRLMRAEGITLAHAHAERCNMVGAKIVDGILSNGFFEGANLSGAVLERVDAKAANFHNATMEYVQAQEANFQEAILDEVKAKGANFSDADMEGIKARFADFEQAQLSYIKAEKADFSNSILKEAQAIGAAFDDAVLNRIDGTQINLSYATLEHASIQRANLEKAVIQHAQANEVNLTESYMKEADLRFSNFQRAILEMVNGERINLENTDVSKSNLRGSNLEEAKTNPKTNLVDSEIEGAIRPEDMDKQRDEQNFHNHPFRSYADLGVEKATEAGKFLYYSAKSMVDGIVPTLTGAAAGFIIGATILAAVFPGAGVPLALMLIGGACVAGASVGYFASTNEARTQASRALSSLTGNGLGKDEQALGCVLRKDVGPDVSQEVEEKQPQQERVQEQQREQELVNKKSNFAEKEEERRKANSGRENRAESSENQDKGQEAVESADSGRTKPVVGKLSEKVARQRAESEADPNKSRTGG